MVELTLWVCLIMDPFRCHAETILHSKSITEYNCKDDGLFPAAQWNDAHREFAVVGWTCENGDGKYM